MSIAASVIDVHPTVRRDKKNVYKYKNNLWIFGDESIEYDAKYKVVEVYAFLAKNLFLQVRSQYCIDLILLHFSFV